MRQKVEWGDFLTDDMVAVLANMVQPGKGLSYEKSPRRYMEAFRALRQHKYLTFKYHLADMPKLQISIKGHAVIALWTRQGRVA